MSTHILDKIMEGARIKRCTQKKMIVASRLSSSALSTMILLTCSETILGVRPPNSTLFEESVTRMTKIRCACYPICSNRKDFCDTSTDVGCFVMSDYSTDQRIIRRGCGHDEVEHMMYCMGKRDGSWSTEHVAMTCCTEDMCNKDIVHEIKPLQKNQVAKKEQVFNYMLVLAIIVPVIVLVIFLFVAWYFFRSLRKNRQESQENLRVREELLPEEYGMRATEVGDSTLKEILEESCTSGSGSGLPFHVQRTIARQVTLLECIDFNADVNINKRMLGTKSQITIDNVTC